MLKWSKVANAGNWLARWFDTRSGWVAAGLAYAISFVVIVVFARYRVVPGVVAGLVVLILVSLTYNWTLLRHRAIFNGRWTRRAVLPVLMVGAGVGALAVWWATDRPDGVGFAGFCLTFLGIGHLLGEIRSSAPHPRAGVTIVVLCALAAAVGSAVPVESWQHWGGWLVLAAVLVAPVGLSLTTGAVLRRLERKPPRVSVAVAAGVVAVGLLTAGIWQAAIIMGTLDVRYAVIAGLLVLAVVAAISSNTTADVLIVVAASALLWSILPRSVPLPEEARPDPGETVMVALGDSFISGEGAALFFEGTNRKADNECRRAPTAYPPLVLAAREARIPEDLAFLACSGARAKHIDQQPQYAGEPAGEPGTDGPNGAARRGLTQLRHLAWLRDAKDLDVAAVIVSVGGNDARFGEIAGACVGPGDCTEIGAGWLAHLNRVKGEIDRAYQSIRREVGDRTPIIVVPYPVPLADHGCGYSLLNSDEHRFLYGFTGQLNNVLRRAAADAGLYYLDEMSTVLARQGLRLCDGPAGDVGVNFFSLHPKGGMAEDGVDPRNWFHNSLHPNEAGHAAMADAVRAWLAAHPNLKPGRDPVPAREEGPPAIASMGQIMADPNYRHCGSPASGLAHCDPVDKWFPAQVQGLVRRGIPALVTLVVGAWIVSVALIWAYRRYPRRNGVAR